MSTHDEATVERVAKALFAVYETGVAWDDAPEEVRFLMRALARAALDAMPPQPVCDGGCSYNDGPDETCSAHGRPVAEVWEIVAQIAKERDALRDAATKYTESEVATAVYRHFTTPSREQVMRTLDASDPEGGNTNEDGIEFWGEQADAILALFEQNGAEHE